ncbi:hypothetical protein HDF12_000816 [Edaphobacter lichenicola]|uniref:Uncharacterized protein n=1 Tax=Tunturiibacter lichenicola TaxID=2051959 RepID=A0A7Y9NJD2_9BACT|nr:hypothetical protein [Edaphobacter lichenicola]
MKSGVGRNFLRVIYERRIDFLVSRARILTLLVLLIPQTKNLCTGLRRFKTTVIGVGIWRVLAGNSLELAPWFSTETA